MHEKHSLLSEKISFVEINGENKELSLNTLIDSRACYKPEKKLWFRGIRPSKFRHVYGLPSRKESCYTDISLVRNGNDGNLPVVNPLFLAIVADVSFVVIPINNTGRIDFQCCKVVGHAGQVLDIKWDPFNDHQIASASDDCTVKLWTIPEGGLTSNLLEYSIELAGHKRKVTNIVWHPTAVNVIISAGFDNLIIVWDVSPTNDNNIMNVINCCHIDMIYSLDINRDGSLIATTSKDRMLRIIEPRSGIVVSEGICHMGTKCSKVVFLCNGKVLTTGFSKHSDRQYAIWNQHDLKEPLIQEFIDSSSGVLQPFFDFDTKVLYLAGKGDGNIRYYEIIEEAPYIYYLNQFLSGHPQKALGFMPKRGLNVGQCEVFRFYKLHAGGNICEPISMIVPRKSTLFQVDLFPDTLSGKPATNSKDWLSGRNVHPILMSLQTGQMTLDDPKKIFFNKSRKGKESQNAEKDNNVVDNNTKKFAFLAQPTTIDYRTQCEKVQDKNQKTTTNQGTKFSQLQSIFGKQHPQNNSKDLNNLQNNSLYNDGITSLKNSSLENINMIHTENELKKIIYAQADELKKVRNQLKTSDKRIRELEFEVKKLKLENN